MSDVDVLLSPARGESIQPLQEQHNIAYLAVP